MFSARRRTRRARTPALPGIRTLEIHDDSDRRFNAGDRLRPAGLKKHAIAIGKQAQDAVPADDPRPTCHKHGFAAHGPSSAFDILDADSVPCAGGALLAGPTSRHTFCSRGSVEMMPTTLTRTWLRASIALLIALAACLGVATAPRGANNSRCSFGR